MEYSKTAKFLMYSSASSNTLGMFCQCFVAFATYSKQHEDHVEVLSWLVLAYASASAFLAWAEWKENVNYDGEKFLKNHMRARHSEQGTYTLVPSTKALSTPAGTKSSRKSDEEPFTCSEIFTMAKVGFKDILEISFIYFATKLFVINTIDQSGKTIAPLNQYDFLGLAAYWLVTLPFKYHSKILNSALLEVNSYKTNFKFSAPLFWLGVLGHSLEHCLPLVLLMGQLVREATSNEALLFSGFVVATVFFSTTETLFTRGFDGKACLERSDGKTKQWELSPCFKTLLKWTWPYKPVARIAENVLALMSLINIVMDVPKSVSFSAALVLSVASGAGAYYVDVIEAGDQFKNQEPPGVEASPMLPRQSAA